MKPRLKYLIQFLLLTFSVTCRLYACIILNYISQEHQPRDSNEVHCGSCSPRWGHFHPSPCLTRWFRRHQLAGAMSVRPWSNRESWCENRAQWLAKGWHRGRAREQGGASTVIGQGGRSGGWRLAARRARVAWEGAKKEPEQEERLRGGGEAVAAA